MKYRYHGFVGIEVKGWQDMGEGLLSVQRILRAFSVPIQSNLDSLFDVGFFRDSPNQSAISNFSPYQGIAIDGDLGIRNLKKNHEE